MGSNLHTGAYHRLSVAQALEPMTRVVLVDDHEMVRLGLVQILRSTSGVEVVAEAGTIAQALPRIAATRPDVAVLDMRLPDGSGIALCREIRSSFPATKCLILSAYDDEEAALEAVLAGASGYLLKTVRGPSLGDAILTAAAGGSLLSGMLVKRIDPALSEHDRDDPRFGTLSLRERQVLRLIADGLANREIGARLGLTEKTVKNYTSNLLRKMGMERRTQAAVYEVARRTNVAARHGP